jgi:hypothetical protein
MKKFALATLLTGTVACGAFAQGSLNGVTALFSADSIVLPGADATNPNDFNQTYYGGSSPANVTFALYYAASAAVSASQVTSINSDNGTVGGGDAAQAALTADGFTFVSTPNYTTSTTALATYSVNSGTIQSGPDELGLVGVPTGGSGWLAVVVSGTGAYAGYSGVLVWNQANLGGNPLLATPGLTATVAQDPAGQNLVLTAPSVPEPATMALAALGGASLLLFRRKK